MVNDFITLDISNLPSSTFIDEGIANDTISGVRARSYAVVISLRLLPSYWFAGMGGGIWPQITGLYSLEYPHNLMVEQWLEYGLLGLSFFLLILLYTLVGIYRRSPCAYVAGYLLLNSFVSGSLRDSRFILLFSMLHIYYSAMSQTDNKGVSII